MYQLDCQTGQTVNCFTGIFIVSDIFLLAVEIKIALALGHDNFVHKVKVLGLATQSAPKVLSCDDGGAILQYGGCSILCSLIAAYQRAIVL